jgi:hypothetical protein
MRRMTKKGKARKKSGWKTKRISKNIKVTFWDEPKKIGGVSFFTRKKPEKLKDGEN